MDGLPPLAQRALGCCVGSKMGLDATEKLPGEGQVRDWPDELTMSPEITDRVTRRWIEYGLGYPAHAGPSNVKS